MTKVLSVTNESACIGCDLCVLAASRAQSENKSVSLNASAIDVKKVDGKYKVNLDPAADLDAQEIVNICPTGVFSVEETQGYE